MGWSTTQANAALKRAGVKDHLAQACGEPAKRHKYNAVPAVIDGIRFDSKAEARQYQTLKVLEGMGLVTELRLQPRYELQAKFTDAQGVKHRAVSYCGDFEFMRDRVRICADVKGIRTAAFNMKWKLVIQKYPKIQFAIWS